MSGNKDDALLTPRQVGHRLGVSTNTLSQWRTAQGRKRSLPFIRLGNRVRYRRSDVEAFIALNEFRALALFSGGDA